jgi:SAM-dependent methyltransferase
MNNWDYLYSKGVQGKHPSEMLIRFINANLIGANKKYKVLDLGCGTGRHLVYLAKNKFEVFGIDGSDKAISISKEWLRQEKLNASIKVGSILDASLYEKNLDVVIDISSMQHNLIEEIRAIVDIAYESLSKGGYFFSISKNPFDSLFQTGELVEGNTYQFLDSTEKVNAPVIITFLDLAHLQDIFSKFSELAVEKEEWTFDGMKKIVSHWVIRARK